MRFEEYLSEQIIKIAKGDLDVDPQFPDRLRTYFDLLKSGVSIDRAKRIMNLYVEG